MDSSYKDSSPRTLLQGLFYNGLYAPPRSSPYAEPYLYEDLTTEIGSAQNLGGEVLIAGDFNARTGTTSDISIDVVN